MSSLLLITVSTMPQALALPTGLREVVSLPGTSMIKVCECVLLLADLGRVLS